jgi:hypothetical protein
MGHALPNTVKTWQRNRTVFPPRNSLGAILLVAEQISMEYNVGQPDGSTTLNEINVGYLLRIKRNEKWMYNVTLRPALVTNIVLET